MLYMSVICHFRRGPLPSHEGFAAFVDLALLLQKLPPFHPGWEVNGVPFSAPLADIEAGFRTIQPPGDDGDLFFAAAESAQAAKGRPLPPERYTAFFRYDRLEGNQELRLSIVPSLTDAPMLREVIATLAVWWPLQHVQAVYESYPHLDSPLDQRNRAGIGWAGWIPFQVTAESLPEVGIVSPLGPGTFLATQRAFWDLTDPEAVKRAQDLEIRLNAIGMLPTHEALRAGTWGQT
ncbi:Imm52 family immunity protein [Actibacterium sp. 188UL27-1]|uniref:Imm52 family immunity protein n=1 Tax=Actibacterium sp. 188UL27-1 TaxID=2786961 RepID=UPI001956A09A|nr:Imm52 family immunity protein [Actibacterium sp. 188UL27-1]MBM7066484.1 immunity 52 family protein [Actibacterium sp. 188UL27-1]